MGQVNKRMAAICGIAAAVVIGSANLAMPANAEGRPAAKSSQCHGKPLLSGLSLPAERIHSGARTSGTVRLSCASRRATTVTLTSGDASWVGVPATVTVPAGKAEAGFDVQTFQPDYIDAGFTVPITASLNANTVTRTLTLQPGLRRIGFGNGTGTTSLISGDGFSLDIGLNGNAPEGGTVVTLESDNTAVQVPKSVTIRQGGSGISGGFGKSTRVPEDVVVTITAKLPGQMLTATLNLRAWTYDPGAWTLSGPESMYGGGFYYQMRVELPNPVPHGGVKVSLTSDNSKVITSEPVALPEGWTGADFEIYATSDIDAMVTLTATIEGVSTRTHQIHVLPGLKQSFEGIPWPLTGGQTFEATVNLGTATSQDLVIKLESDNPVLQVPAEVVIPAGQSSATFTVTTTEVADFQAATLTATLGNTVMSETIFIEPANP
ncbi:hypothetical protein ACRYCC_10180 [Actinomadura scrupuli]|uniref:hypothetical protein n=1 Tax=Actinomadura scrupuli TaxID=559629 RepID=UPI003D980A04